MSKITDAGKQLFSGHIGKAIMSFAKKDGGYDIPALATPIQPGRYRNGNYFFGVNGNDKAFIWGAVNSSLLAYQSNPIVSAVINKLALASVNGKKFVMDTEGKEMKGAYADGVRKVLKKPNFIQNGTQFRAQNKTYKRIYGYCPVLRMVPAGYEKYPEKWMLWNLPPWMVQVEDADKNFWEMGDSPFRAIKLTYRGQTINLPLESVFFIRENQISTSTFMSNSAIENVSLWLPDSKLVEVADNIANFNDSMASRGSLIRQRGPMWILSNDSSDSGESGLFPIIEKDKQALQDDFLQYGMLAGQRKAIITDAKLKLQEVGFDVSQLKLLEGEVQDAKTICDALGYPPYLLGLVDSKFDNQDVAERSLYTNTVIPDEQSDDEQWDDIFGLDALGMSIQTDYSHLPALQEDATEQGRSRFFLNQALQIEFLNGLLTWNEWREALGQDTKPGMDKYYYELVALGMIVPAPVAAPAGLVGEQPPTSNSNSSSSNN